MYHDGGEKEEHTMKEMKNRMVNERDFKPDPNYVPADPEKARLVLKLGNMITDRYLVKYSRTMNYSDPEYWMLVLALIDLGHSALIQKGQSVIN